jgi:hypothetical protein
MTYDKNLRQAVRWEFTVVDGLAGQYRWRWMAYDSAGTEIFRSETDFDTLTACVEDAKDRGYSDPERR